MAVVEVAAVRATAEVAMEAAMAVAVVEVVTAATREVARGAD